MATPETELKYVWLPGDGGEYSLCSGAKRIWLACDGQGLSGHYDRIHIELPGHHFVIPAHQAGGWELATKEAPQ